MLAAREATAARRSIRGTTARGPVPAVVGVGAPTACLAVVTAVTGAAWVVPAVAVARASSEVALAAGASVPVGAAVAGRALRSSRHN
jgi:hypothetical protein